MTPEASSEYRAQAVAQSAPLRGTDAWVNWVNRAADRMRELAIQEAAQDPTGSSFAQLLRDELPNVRLWSAHHFLELFTERSAEETSAALSIIEAAAHGESAAAFGEQLWLKEWRQNHPGG
jgi:hypothetical protein